MHVLCMKRDGMLHLEWGSVKGQNKWDVAIVARIGTRGHNANAIARAIFNARGVMSVWAQSTEARSG